MQHGRVTLQHIYESMSRSHPTLLRATAPRRYALPFGYRDPRTAGAMFAYSAVVAGKPPYSADDVALTSYLTTCVLIAHDVPTFFVARDLLAAIRATALPDDYSLEALRWPHPALLLALPVDSLMTPRDGPCAFIAVGRQLPDERWDIPGYRVCVVPPPGRLTVVGIAGGAGGATAFADQRPLAGTIGRLFPDDRPSLEWTGASSAPLRGDDASFLSDLTALALRIVLVMQARPDLVDSGLRIARPARHKKGRERSALWHPNFIGRDYSPPSQPAAASSREGPRAHWRRGHWRNQAVGPRTASEHRLRWIEPTLVGLAAPASLTRQ